jgi:hypothetical protein
MNDLFRTIICLCFIFFIGCSQTKEKDISGTWYPINLQSKSQLNSLKISDFVGEFFMQKKDSSTYSSSLSILFEKPITKLNNIKSYVNNEEIGEHLVFLKEEFLIFCYIKDYRPIDEIAAYSRLDKVFIKKNSNLTHYFLENDFGPKLIFYNDYKIDFEDNYQFQFHHTKDIFIEISKPVNPLNYIFEKEKAFLGQKEIEILYPWSKELEDKSRENEVVVYSWGYNQIAPSLIEENFKINQKKNIGFYFIGTIKEINEREHIYSITKPFNEGYEEK